MQGMSRRSREVNLSHGLSVLANTNSSTEIAHTAGAGIPKHNRNPPGPHTDIRDVPNALLNGSNTYHSHMASRAGYTEAAVRRHIRAGVRYEAWLGRLFSKKVLLAAAEVLLYDKNYIKCGTATTWLSNICSLRLYLCHFQCPRRAVSTSHAS